MVDGKDPQKDGEANGQLPFKEVYDGNASDAKKAASHAPSTLPIGTGDAYVAVGVA